MTALTVTLNPAIDQTVLLGHLRPGHVHRAQGVSFNAGGKGVNVASCLADWGDKVSATGFLGENNTLRFETLFMTKLIEDAFIRIPGETRTNIKLSHDGDTTDINLPGLTPNAEELQALVSRINALATTGTLALLAGSLPGGVDEGFYAALTEALAKRGARVLLDTSGAPLKAALAGAVLPFCLKPNRAELEQFAGHNLTSDAAVIEAARGLIARGVQLVVVSLGEDGALFITQSQVLRASLPVVHAASTVGAGDAMVAGIMAALREEAGLERIARLSTAFAAGKLTLAGPNLPPRGDIEALSANVKIQNIQE
ncbi:1-phosphofructokinase [Acidocella aromatica]|uniref:Phosphofructokinase n=1 Tax=Acidocella aromatica TaxID=1303579 RepID=A0A840VEI9_9PROT|nr:1-phosphofructokinase [Acidocella aromatica]MBB5374248.1 1-phosphofructokinase [Acidocella aromatica]